MLKRLDADYSLLDYVREAFDGYAPHFETSMTQLSYRAHEMLFSALQEVLGELQKDQLGNVLDIGCGTGLLGEKLRQFAKELRCVDASGKMLEVARKKDIYDHCLQASIVTAVKAQTDIDTVLASDVLPFVGPLEDLFKSAGQTLRSGALLGFTVEGMEFQPKIPHEEQGQITHEKQGRSSGWNLLPTGRHAHNKEYVQQALEGAHFEVLAVGDGPLRWVHGRPIAGHVFVARRT